MSPSRRPSARVLAALGAGVVLLVLLVVALAGGGDDEIEIVRGAPDQGFPLRGDLAGDETKIRAAVDSWGRRERRDGGEFAGDDGDGVTVLWAGRTEAGTDTVVLAAEFDAAVLTRSDAGDDDYWQVSDATIGSARDPVVVAGTDGVLVRAGVPSAFRQAGREGDGSPVLRQTDGLWHRGGSDLPDGAVLLPRGLRTRMETAPREPAAVFTGEGAAVRALSPELLERLESGSASRQGPDASRLLAAARAAGTLAPGERPRNGDRDRFTPERAPVLSLVADRTLDPIGAVLVLGVEDPARGPRRSLVAATGDGADSDDPAAFKLGAEGDDAPTGLRGPTGPAFGAAYVRRAGAASDRDAAVPTYLLVAGQDDVTEIEVLAGRRTIRREGSVALVAAPWLRTGATGGSFRGADVAVLGRTASGSIVVPPPVRTTTYPAD